MKICQNRMTGTAHLKICQKRMTGTGGCGAAVLGHPAASVAMLANMMAARGEEIPVGTFIMTGGITAAVAVVAGGCINVRYQHLGCLGFRFV